MVGNTYRYGLRGLYELTGNLHGKNVYTKHHGDYMIWFDGEVSYPDWVIGSSSNIDEGFYTYGYLQSNDDTNCPEDSEEWDEWWSSWITNQDAFVRPYSPIGCCIKKSSTF